MSSIFRKQNIITNCRHFISSSVGPKSHYNNNINHSIYSNNSIIKNSARQEVHYVKYYSRKTGKEVNAPAFAGALTSNGGRAFRGFGFIGWYLGNINARPLLTKSFTSSFIYALADLTSQTIALPSSEPYDFIRTLRMAGYGLMVLGPTLHYWFNFMSKVLPGRDLLSTAKKMILGQTVYGPIITVVFFSLNAALQGENAKEIVARLRRDFVPTMVNCVIYWPVCDFITFRFAPVHLQPLVSNGFSFVWTIYMTYMASLKKASGEISDDAVLKHDLELHLSEQTS